MQTINKLSLGIKIYLGYALICLGWGASWAAVKIGMQNVPPMLAIGTRLFFASAIFGIIIFLFNLKTPKEKIFWKTVSTLALTSFIAPFVFIYWGQKQIDSGLASVLFATFPLWVSILSHFFIPKEQITLIKILGIAIGFVGVIVIFNSGFSDWHNASFLGMIAIVIGAIMQSVGLVVLRINSNNAHPIVSCFWSMFLSVPPLLMCSFIFEDFSNFVIDNNVLFSFAFLTVFCTVMTFAIYFWLVKHLQAVTLSLSSFITPIIAIIIGIIFLDEVITNSIYIGSALIIIGVAGASIGDFLKNKLR